MVDERLRLPLICIIAWLAGVILWNVAGVVLIATTGAGIGPTASLTLAGIMIVVATLVYLAARFSGIGFAALAALCAVAAFAGVYQAFVGDASFWPTPFWRWAGAALNLFGFVAGLFGVVNGMRARRKTR